MARFDWAKDAKAAAAWGRVNADRILRLYQVLHAALTPEERETIQDLFVWQDACRRQRQAWRAVA